MTPDYLQDALTKLNEAITDQQFDSLVDSTTITLDIQAAMVIYEAANTFHKETVLRNTAEAAIIAAQCRGSIARIPKIDRCTCKVPELPVGFTKWIPGQTVPCQKCKKILLTQT